MTDIDYQTQAAHRIGMLANHLRTALETPGMTMRNVAAFTGVDKSTIARAKHQKPISTQAFLALDLWLADSAGQLETVRSSLSALSSGDAS